MLWLFEPRLRPDDPTWQGRRQFARVVVRARSAAMARELAAPLDTPAVALQQGQQDPHLGSGLRSEKLYAVRSIAEDPASAAPFGFDQAIVEAVDRPV